MKWKYYFHYYITTTTTPTSSYTLIKSLLYARSTDISFNLHNNHEEVQMLSPFTDEETEA